MLIEDILMKNIW